MQIPLFNTVLSWILKKRKYQIDMFIDYPIETQKEVLFNILNSAKDTELGKKYGFDTKFAYNLIRLLLEGAELLETKQITFPLKERKLLRDIRNGKYSRDEVFKLAKEYEDKMREIKLQIDRFKSDYNKANQLLIEILSSTFFKEVIR